MPRVDCPRPDRPAAMAPPRAAVEEPRRAPGYFRELLARPGRRLLDRDDFPPEARPQPAPAWTVPDGAPGALSTTRPLAAIDAPRFDRILVGTGPAGAEARLSIDRGPLAGTELHLRAGPQGVDASVLTATESSRQTLTSAMDAVARRLETRGHVLRTSFAGAGRQDRGQDPRR